MEMTSDNNKHMVAGFNRRNSSEDSKSRRKSDLHIPDPSNLSKIEEKNESSDLTPIDPEDPKITFSLKDKHVNKLFDVALKGLEYDDSNNNGNESESSIATPPPPPPQSMVDVVGRCSQDRGVNSNVEQVPPLRLSRPPPPPPIEAVLGSQGKDEPDDEM